MCAKLHPFPALDPTLQEIALPGQNRETHESLDGTFGDERGVYFGPFVRFLFTVEDDRAIKADNILVGTASWSDPGFVERWYPKGMRAADRLPWYAEHFEIVEVNSTFYSVPDPRMVERWCRATPDHFIFDVKLHRLLSRHSTPLKMLPR